jgi:Zn-dependent protease with chaperone function
MNAFAFWNADKLVLRMHGAREVTPDERDPALYQFARDTADMAHNAGMPAPRIYVIENRSAQRLRHRAVISITRLSRPPPGCCPS